MKASSTSDSKARHRDPGSGGCEWGLDLALREGWFVLQAAGQGVILLDTNALLWVYTGHARGRTLARASGLYISPVSLLELAFLEESQAYSPCTRRP